jgi:4-diphosphocytidyl-2-C-methyl-D-erythritol kinase
MVSFPPCKINLGLNIIRKREDGYHDIETCFYPIPLTDVLEVIPSNELMFTSSGNSIPGEASDNLCMKAYALLKKDFSLPGVKIHLHKIIPTGAGLGGGSSNAAHTLLLLNAIFELNLSSQKLMTYASLLGSDCSFFIGGKPMLGSGRGEILKPLSLSLKGKFLILMNPGLHVSTADAYSRVVPGPAPLAIESILSMPLETWRKVLQNEFEKSVFERFPLIANLKDHVYESGALYASMSGSGSSVFGIFDKEVPVAHRAFEPYVIWKGYLE